MNNFLCRCEEHASKTCDEHVVRTTEGVSYHCYCRKASWPIEGKTPWPPCPPEGCGRGINTISAEGPVPPGMGRSGCQPGTRFLFSGTATCSCSFLGQQAFPVLSVGEADPILGHVTQAWPMCMSHPWICIDWPRDVHLISIRIIIVLYEISASAIEKE